MISKRKLGTGNFNSLGIICVIVGVSFLIEFSEALRVSRKCPYGHYFNDGCVSCWCDKGTGHTVCERMTLCPRIKVKCPMGRKYRDECDNECSCFESTGAIFCKERGQCNSIKRRQTLQSKISSFDPRDLEDFEVPDPVYHQKDEIIIEPALIIRRKPSFKKSNNKMDYNIDDYPLISSSDPHPHDLQELHSPSVYDLRKSPTTLLYLYEKQLKSMNEFRSYYKDYLKNGDTSSNFPNLFTPTKPPLPLGLHPPPPPRPLLGPYKNMKPPPPRPSVHIQFPKIPLSIGHNFKVMKPHPPPPPRTGGGHLTSPSSRSTATASYGSYDPRLNDPPKRPSTLIPVVTQRPLTSFRVTTAPYTPFKVTINTPVENNPNTVIHKGVESDLKSMTPSGNKPLVATGISVQKGIENSSKYFNHSSNSGQPFTASSTRSSIVDFSRGYISSSSKSPIRFQSSTREPLDSTPAPKFYSTSKPLEQIPLGSSYNYEESERFNYHASPTSTSTPTPRPDLPEGPTVRAELNKPIYINHILAATIKPPAEFYSHKKFILPPLLPPRPKQYRLILKNNDRKPLFYSDNNKVPHFVDKIAREFFRKPEIYVPKMKNGRPLLERVVFNHKEIIPKELILEPGGQALKVSFSPEAERQMEREWNADKVVVEVDKEGQGSELFYDNVRFESNKGRKQSESYHDNLETHQAPEIHHQYGEIYHPEIYNENPPIYNDDLETHHQNSRTDLRNHEHSQNSHEIIETHNERPESYQNYDTQYDTNKPIHHEDNSFSDPHYQDKSNFVQTTIRNYVTHHTTKRPFTYQTTRTPTTHYNTTPRPQINYSTTIKSRTNPTEKYETQHKITKKPHQSSETYEEIFHKKPEHQIPSPKPQKEDEAEYYEDSQSSEYYEEDEETPKPKIKIPQVTETAYEKVLYSVGNSNRPESIRVTTYHPHGSKNEINYQATESEYIPVSPRPGPSFVIPREEQEVIDDYGHYNNPIIGDLLPQEAQPQPQPAMIIESIAKSHEVSQKPKHEVAVDLNRQKVQEVIQNIQLQHKMGEVGNNIKIKTPKPALTYDSTEINHDQIIREILSMDPEIGPDAILIKSDGKTVPTVSTSTSTTASTPVTRTVRIEPDIKSTLTKTSVKVQPTPPGMRFKIPQINLKADAGIINLENSEDMATASSTYAPSTKMTTTESPFDLSPFYKELFRPSRENIKPDALVDTEGVAKIFSYDLQKSKQVYQSSSVVGGGGGNNNGRNLGKRDEKNGEKTHKDELKSTTMETIESVKKEEGQQTQKLVEGMVDSTINNGDKSKDESKPKDESGPDDPSSSFRKELDWKSQLMSNICEVNPNSALCLTYKSLCMLMST